MMLQALSGQDRRLSVRLIVARLVLALLVAGTASEACRAQAKASPGATPASATAAATSKPAGAPLSGFGSNSKEPIKIDANKLEVFDKESRAVFTGDVVAVQGQTTMRCTVMVRSRTARARSQVRSARASSGCRACGACRRAELDQADRLHRPGFAPLRNAIRNKRKAGLRGRQGHRHADRQGS